jgi:hypothetical protein
MRALALLVLVAGCSTAPPPAPGASVTIGGRRVEAAVFGTEKARRGAREGLRSPGPGRGHLLAWPRDRFVRLESEGQEASFDAVLVDLAGRVVEVRRLLQGDAEGVMSKVEAAYALLVDPGSLAAKPGDRAEIAHGGAVPQDLPELRIGGALARVELAVTEADRMHGLMHRPRMSADDGMLFTYDHEARRSYWMKNTLIPLDIAFFSADGTLLNVNETPMYKDPANPGPDYATSDSAGPAQYVLEMNLGWFRRKGLLGPDGKAKPGLRAELPREATEGFPD